MINHDWWKDEFFQECYSPKYGDGEDNVEEEEEDDNNDNDADDDQNCRKIQFKYDLFLRFVMAYRHGYGGIQSRLNIPQKEMENIQETVIRRIRWKDRVVIFPVQRTRPFVWSCVEKGTQLVDLRFRSNALMKKRRQLMEQIRNVVRQRSMNNVSSLYHISWFACSTLDLQLWNH